MYLIFTFVLAAIPLCLGIITERTKAIDQNVYDVFWHLCMVYGSFKMDGSMHWVMST
jgi:uncharacterized membrane protein